MGTANLAEERADLVEMVQIVLVAWAACSKGANHALQPLHVAGQPSSRDRRCEGSSEVDMPREQHTNTHTYRLPAAAVSSHTSQQPS